MKINETKTLFSVEICDDGSYFAVSSAEPLFCIHGNTIQEVVESAVKALNFYNTRLAQ